MINNIKIPNDWNYEALSSMTSEKIVYGIVQAGPHVDDGIPYIKSSDVESNINIDKLQNTSIIIHEKYGRSEVKPGDVVFSLRGNIGETSIVPISLPKANLTQGTARIRVKDSNSNIFIRYQLANTNILNRIHAVSKGSTFKEISLEELRKLEIPRPNLKKEQTKIANILSTWDKSIDVTEKLIENSQTQKKALMQQLLSGKTRLKGFNDNWEKVRLEKLLEQKKQKGKTVQTNQDKRGIPYIGSASFDGKFFLYTNSKEAIKCIPTDILILWDGEYAGKVATNLKGAVSSTVSRYRLNKKIDNQFIAYCTYRDNYKIRAIREGSGIPHMPGDFEHWYIVSLPSFKEQQKIAAVLAATDKEIELLQQKLTFLQQEKKALMQQLLTGKRRVKVDKH